MYKTILVHVDGSADSAKRVDLASRLAVAYDAHLTGAALTGLPPQVFPVGGFEAGLPTVTFHVEELRASADSALDAFEDIARRAGVKSFARQRTDEDNLTGLILQSRYADLVVMSRESPRDVVTRLRSDLAESLLLSCARPVLLVPPDGFNGEVGHRVTVAWNGSAEAVRAITSAIPLLQRAQQVSLVIIDSDLEGNLRGEEPGANICSYLARHGITAQESAGKSRGGIGETLLEFAHDQGSDLIVMGAYGRSRFAEIVIGGASRSVLSSSPLPLWMAH